jgi:hypothetical protein
MRNRFKMLCRASLGLTLLGCMATLPAFAADHEEKSGETAMPATEHQSENVRNVPESADDMNTGEQMPTSEDMPATKAQKEGMKEQDKMSQDPGMSESGSGDSMSGAEAEQ